MCTHERLRKARSGLVALGNEGTLFTYLDPALSAERPLPATSNRNEGGVNAPLRSMLGNHRGMSVIRRIKAVFWWNYMKTECRLPAAQILAQMPRDDDVDALYELYGSAVRPDDGASQWGDGLVWSEFHHATAYPLRCRLASRHTFCPMTLVGRDEAGLQTAFCFKAFARSADHDGVSLAKVRKRPTWENTHRSDALQQETEAVGAQSPPCFGFVSAIIAATSTSSLCVFYQQRSTT